MPILLALAAGALGVYLLGCLVAGDRLPRSAVVAGVPVGGLTPVQAREKLVAELEPRAAAPIVLLAPGKQASVDPSTAGLRLDYERSIARAGGGSRIDPRRIWRLLTGGGSTDAVVAVDEDALAAATAKVAPAVQQEPADARLAYQGTDVQLTEAQDGVTLRQDRAAAAIADGYLGDGPVRLPVETVPPLVTTADATRVRVEYAEPAVSGPVTVRAGAAGRFRLTPAMIADALSFPAADGTLVPHLDPARLKAAAADAVDAVEVSRPRDAGVRISNGRPQVVPAVDGTTVDADALAKAVEPVLTERGDRRTAEITLTGAKARFSTADAERLGVREVTGQFTTYFPYAEYRNVNIGRAAELINGTLLRPGETFSLNKVVGERTKANGFTEGFIISGGKFKRELGGGVSQSATTTFNAMFFAGLEDVEHQPHTLYIDRYPPGREATVAWPDLDLKFRNDTRYGVLVQASTVRATAARRGSITVRMWSTKTYDKVESTALAKSRFTSGRDLVDTSASCEPQPPAQGFDVRYQRLFHRDGKVVKRQSFFWRYGPTDRIRCG
ncbi:MAG: VanW family protein [Friedmanniella sp.]